MQNIVLIIALAVLCFIIGLLVGYNAQRRVFIRAVPRQQHIPEGQCLHCSRRAMKVTQFGDDEDRYLCLLCGEKVKASELYGGLDGP